MSRPVLWLVPTPLDFGLDAAAPLGDLLPAGTVRQAAALGHFVVENAKTARAFLKRVDAAVPLVRPLQQLDIVELPRPAKGAGPSAAPTDERALAALLAPLRQGQDLGLLSEAGLPAVADPGARLVALAHREGFAVRSLAGSSSLTQALAAGGMNGQCFAFQGYLPQDAGARAARIRELEAQSRKGQQTQLAIETPYRNQALLDALVQTLQPSTQLAVSLALTTPQETTHSQPVARWRATPLQLPKDQPAIFSWLASG